jgi:hypothetical protein
MMNATKPLLAASLLSLCAFSLGANAQSAMSDTQIKADYKAADKACDAMKGDQKDACQAKAKADRDSARADLKASKKNAETRHDAMKDKNDAQFKAAKAQCDTMSGDAEDRCMADAKTKFNK